MGGDNGLWNFRLQRLRQTLTRAAARPRHKVTVLQGCIAHCGLQFRPLSSVQ